VVVNSDEGGNFRCPSDKSRAFREKIEFHAVFVQEIILNNDFCDWLPGLLAVDRYFLLLLR